jgi:hypothetical protein
MAKNIAFVQPCMIDTQKQKNKKGEILNIYIYRERERERERERMTNGLRKHKQEKIPE